MVKIGNKSIDTNIFLAPLSGVSDLPFRLIAREHGARFCFYEMIDSNSITRGRDKSTEILKTHKMDSPIAGQLLGSCPDMMLDAAQKLLELAKIEFLDVNFACPAKKVVKKKAGAFLLQEPVTIAKILKKLSHGIKIPVTAKLRIGYDKKDERHMIDLARICEANGAGAIFVHGRTRSQGYAGDVDYKIIGSIKGSVNIPVLGTGNIFTPQLAKMMLDLTGCDGILVARGAMGNPWIFKEIEDYLKNGMAPTHTTLPNKVRVLKEHLNYIEIYKNMRPRDRVGFMKKVAVWYLKSFDGAKRIRESICRAKSYEEITKILISADL